MSVMGNGLPFLTVLFKGYHISKNILIYKYIRHITKKAKNISEYISSYNKTGIILNGLPTAIV